ncbi:MAG: 16S rRNA (guanine(966)-N(2))-methyltransferase RsmD [Clostridia bacterium]|nr:16S rRNA (guanine(966)-N(2))-methyltransferase RsmD [Clostridia bacterium]
MRIIAGDCRGRIFKAPEGMDTRPTLDRVREAIFGMVQFEVFGRVALDLFAGSGGMGLEALSRGAKRVVFCDVAFNCVSIIKENLKSLGLKGEVYRSDFQDMLKSLKRKNERFDLIFLDPPYAAGYVAEALLLIASLELLNDGGTIILEHDPGLLVCMPEGFCAVKTKKYAAAAVTLIRKAELT